MRIFIKEPGKRTREADVANDLHTLQELVGGHIEAVQIFSDLAVICNEEGRLMDLPHCCEVCGIDFCGPVLFAGTKRDRFCSVNYDGTALEFEWEVVDP